MFHRPEKLPTYHKFSHSNFHNSTLLIINQSMDTDSDSDANRAFKKAKTTELEPDPEPVKKKSGNATWGINELWKREIGQVPPRKFSLKFSASEDLVLRLGVRGKLKEHRGCVNTLSFNSTGDILVSGSDDRKVVLWDWDREVVKLSFYSGHSDNIFQAKLMPYSDDRSIVTCAGDGQVRHTLLREDGSTQTTLLGKHDGRTHQLAVEPGSPHTFYTSGEDGVVQHFDLRSGAATELFTCQSYKSPRHKSITLYTISIDPRSPNVFAVAGGDEFARVYDIRRCELDRLNTYCPPMDYFCPSHLVGGHKAGITGLVFSEQSELLVSYCSEDIYLFRRDMGLGRDPPFVKRISSSEITVSESGVEESGKNEPQVYKEHSNSDTVKGVSLFGPKDEYVVSGSDCGRIFIWRKKNGELLRAMEADKRIVNCIVPHPYDPVLASSGIDNDIKIWTPNTTNKATLPVNLYTVQMQDRDPLYDSDDDDSNYDDLIYDSDFDINFDIEFDNSDIDITDNDIGLNSDDDIDINSDDESDRSDDHIEICEDNPAEPSFATRIAQLQFDEFTVADLQAIGSTLLTLCSIMDQFEMTMDRCTFTVVNLLNRFKAVQRSFENICSRHLALHHSADTTLAQDRLVEQPAISDMQSAKNRPAEPSFATSSQSSLVQFVEQITVFDTQSIKTIFSTIYSRVEHFEMMMHPFKAAFAEFGTEIDTFETFLMKLLSQQSSATAG